MNTYLYLTNFGIAVGALMISIFGLILSMAVQYSENGYKKYFVLLFGFLMAYSASNIAVWVVSEKPGYAYMLASYISLFFESLFSSLLLPLLTMFLLFCAGKSYKKSAAFYCAAALWFAYFVLLIITQFTDWIYYYNADNQYFRGPFYAVLLVPPVLLMAVNLITLFCYRKLIPVKQKRAFFIYIIVPLVCMVVQMFFYGLLMTVLGSAVSALILLLIILFDQLDKYVKQTRENANLRANTLMLQMRPHFVYNTLTSIFCMIEDNPVKAKEVTGNFTNYLRNNFTAIAQDKPIPFTKELEHTKAYLAVEQARFEGQIFFEFDTPVINFRLPALTLQPIVENAIKHGLDPELDPLYISVLTREAENGVEISVTDTGPGFGEIDNDEPHIALKNIRERLELMCGGTLTLTPREQGGTEVTVFIPEKAFK